MITDSPQSRPLTPRAQLHPFLQEKYEAMAALYHTYGIDKVYVFGSLARQADFREDSDVDLLLIGKDKPKPGLAYFTMWEEMEQLFGRKVDIISHPKQLKNPFFREALQRDARLIYLAPAEQHTQSPPISQQSHG
jgi:predicted nucleotidyltransferase